MDARKPIRQLPDTLAMQIAAGEVIERPASVVKELIENAIDAGAQHIQVSVGDGGRQSITIEDDGCGIPEEEAPLAFARHTTSKISSVDDLAKVDTLGFRGEALASIASVAHVEMTTKTAESEHGVRIRIEGGRLTLTEPCGRTKGTTISVSHLFFNTPARKKFLRARATEFGHIEQNFRRIALMEPSRSFSLSHDGKVILEVPPTKDLLGRVRQLYPADVCEKLIAIDTADGPIALAGLVSDSHFSFSRPNEVWTFVNFRPVRDRMLQAAILEGYRTAMMERRYPLAVLNLEIPRALVDVNVHPTKAEVRFSDPQPVFRLLSQSIAAALRKHAGSKSMDTNMGMPNHSTPQYQPSFGLSVHGTPSPASLDRVPENVFPFVSEKIEASAGFSGLQILGCIDQTYWVLQDEEGLVLIDQHAAHERVNFERLKNQPKASHNAQALLVPMTMEVSAQREAVLQRMLPQLSHLGFTLEPFGDRTFVIKSVPEVLERNDPRPLLLDLCDTFGNEESMGAWEDHLDDVLSTIACHSAVRAHESLSEEELRSLLVSLDGLDLSSNCPHGRPTFVRLRTSDLERMFRRK